MLSESTVLSEMSLLSPCYLEAFWGVLGLQRVGTDKGEITASYLAHVFLEVLCSPENPFTPHMARALEGQEN